MNRERSVRKRREYVYVIGTPLSPLVKIGRSVHPERRLRELQGNSVLPLQLLWSTPGGNQMERGLHQHFASKRGVGEWFNLGFEEAAKIVSEAVGIGDWETESFQDHPRSKGSHRTRKRPPTITPFAPKPETRPPLLLGGVLCGHCGHDSSLHEDANVQRCHWTGEEEWHVCQCSSHTPAPGEVVPTVGRSPGEQAAVYAPVAVSDAYLLGCA